MATLLHSGHTMVLPHIPALVCLVTLLRGLMLESLKDVLSTSSVHSWYGVICTDKSYLGF